ncbi:hypothetical protein SAMN04488543_0205 [Friedmanniella luteola]|uniref:AAA ATPase domain-containing protein n=1 Tax=Friedmanniella luteola TaxID=546871 RepID=A0A1H1LCE3_9ACTN|nr:hypothetical protein [Friedmanniella luteola]SDR72234.1 hypothetical protein SAMN04488543_0205 [Friedmanniella luteola]
MVRPDTLRASRDGDQFHYTWAARQSLRLLDASSGLAAILVEAVDPSEHRRQSDQRLDQPGATDEQLRDEDEASTSSTGDEVIDLAEYWGSSDIDNADQVVYRQFKHSTVHPDEPWTFSFLTKTILGFARKYRVLSRDHPAALANVSFEFVTNRPIADSASILLEELRQAKSSRASDTVREKLESVIDGKDIARFAGQIKVDDQASSLRKLRALLAVQVADFLPGAPGDQDLLLREMIASRATSIVGHQPAVRREDVLAALKTSEDQLLPAPNLISARANSVNRHQFEHVSREIRSAQGRPVVIHGPGGVGKSVLSMTLERTDSPGSATFVYDCFGNGSYRRPSAARHQAKQGLIQLANEFASRALCEPLIPSATADDSDYARAFLQRLERAAAALAAGAPDALLTIVIDAADNAAMIAEDLGDRSFVIGLLRESLPVNVRLVVTCRTERRHLLRLPANHLDLSLRGFELDETRAHLELTFPSVSTADAAEFHTRTSHNPRVQATVLDATTSLQEALDWLAPTPVSASVALDAIIGRQVAAVRDSHHISTAEVDEICTGLAALRPMIPARVLGELAGVDESVVLSFVADLRGPLLIDGGTVQFRDEPTETWFRITYRPKGAQLDAFLDRLTPLANHDAYVATSLPALLFEARRFDDLVDLALSDDALPDNMLPPTQRNELQRREIAQQRTHFALTAALRQDGDLAAAKLALRLGALTAGRTRRLSLIADNTDLAAQFLEPHLLEQLVANRSILRSWPNSNLLYEGALLAGAPGQTDQARNRLRSATTWVRAWTQQAMRDGTDSSITEQDILQIAWGLINTDGPGACVEYLRRWKPRTLAFDVGVQVARRLADAGRQDDIHSLALKARGKHLKFAIAQVCAERNLITPPDVTRRLLACLVRRRKRLSPSRHVDQPGAAPLNEQVEQGLTATTWLLTQALSAGIVTPVEALRVLNLYLPTDMGYRTGEFHRHDMWQPVLGFALRAWLEGHELTATEIEGAAVSKARGREKYESSRVLRAYEANVTPLVSWATLWTKYHLEPTPERLLEVSERARSFLARQRRSEFPGEEVDGPQLNITVSVIVALLVGNSTLVPAQEVIEFCERNRARLWRSTLILLTQQASSSPVLAVTAARLARQVHADLATAREDAYEKAKDLVMLARATLRTSAHEAAVHFQAALETSNAIGDDVWERWEALLKVAQVAGETSGDEPGRAYRLGQIAEGIEAYLGDSLDYTRVTRIAAGLHLPEALALASRWRDRRVAPVSRLAEAFCGGGSALVLQDPAIVLALLPLCDRDPELEVLATALKASAAPPGEAIMSLLHFLRARPLPPESLDWLLTEVGLSRAIIAAADPSLLPQTLRDGQGPIIPNSIARDWGSRRDDDLARPMYGEFDLQTTGGWAGALQRAHSANDTAGLFNHVMSGSPSPAVIAAFGKCPAVTEWDLSRFLASLVKSDLSMGAQAALDAALQDLLSRLGAAHLLVSYRLVDVSLMRRLTGFDTDYERVASRALANQVTFSAEQAFALAGHLAARLGPTDRLDLLDAATSLFDDAVPLDRFGGHRPIGMAGAVDIATAVACLIWAALGDPAPETRWRAAHAVRLIVSHDLSNLADRLCEVAIGTVSTVPFRDSRLPFYEKHATQWLVMAVSRASRDASPRSFARFAPIMTKVIKSAPHAVNTPMAREILLLLLRCNLLSGDPQEYNGLQKRGAQIGVVRRTIRARQLNVRAFADLVGMAAAYSLDDPTGNVNSEEGLGSPDRDAIEARFEDSNNEDDEDDNQFRFFFDFRQYWCDELGEAFGLTGMSIQRLVQEVLLERWKIASRGRSEDDPRAELRLYSEGRQTYKSDWPKEEDLDFYLAIQGLYEVAGSLLQLLPVAQTYDEDLESGETAYSRFLARHTPTRSDGRWLADRRDAPPTYAMIRSGSGMASRAQSEDSEWVSHIDVQSFQRELLAEPGRLAVSAYRSTRDYDRSETVRVMSALVTPGTAPALLRALQTSPDKRAYRIPDATDRDYSSAVHGFELTGWLEPQNYSEGLDSKDPFASGVNFPPERPYTGMAGLDDLVPDADMRLWTDARNRIAFVSRVWDESQGGTSPQSVQGFELLADEMTLGARLESLRRWLIIEVEIQRNVSSSSSRSYGMPSNDEERLEHLDPYTKYFLIDFDGALHEL